MWYIFKIYIAKHSIFWSHDGTVDVCRKSGLVDGEESPGEIAEGPELSTGRRVVEVSTDSEN